MKRTTAFLTLALLLGGGTAFAQTPGHPVQIPGTPDPVFGADTIGGGTDHAMDQLPIPSYGTPSAGRQDQQTSYLGWQSGSGGGTDAQSNNVPVPSYGAPLSAQRDQVQTGYLDWQSRSGGGTDAQSNNVPIPSYGAPYVVERTAPTQNARVGDQAVR